MPRFKILFSNYTKETKFRKDDCTREEIESCLEQTRHDTCYFNVEYIFSEGNVGVTLHSENREYYMLYHDTREEDEEGDVILRNYYNPNRSKKIVDSPAEYIQDCMICDDFNIVKEVFQQLIEDKKVSDELLSW